MIEKKFPRKLNSSVDSRLRKADEMIDALNVQVGGDSQGGDQGADLGVIKAANGNTAVDSNIEFTIDENRKVIGKVEDQKYRRIYLFLWCSNKLKEGVYVYDAETNTTNVVYTSNFFNFDQNGFVVGSVVHLTDQAEAGDEKTFLYFTDNVNEPRRIDVSRVQIDQTEYNQYDTVDFITACPASPQKPITFDFDIDIESNVSSLEGTSGFQFAYQNMYYSGEISSPSVHSDIAVPPAYLQQGPRSISDLYMENIINLTVPREGYTREVEKVRILVRYGNNTSFFVVDDVNVDLENDTTYEFRNENLLPIVTELDSTQQFDALPRIAESISVMEDRLFFGNYVESRDRTNAQATLSVGYNPRPQELISYEITVDEHVFEVPPTGTSENMLFPELDGNHVQQIRNRVTGVRLGFANIPNTIEAGSEVRFEIAFGPSRNWHIYNGYKDGTGGETIHGTKRVYIPGEDNEQYKYVDGNLSRSQRFRDNRSITAGKEAYAENKVDHNGGSANTVWTSEKGYIGDFNVSIGTSALHPLIVKGAPSEFSVSLLINEDINRFELKRIISDVLSAKNALQTNQAVGYPLLSYGNDGVDGPRVTVVNFQNNFTYDYNLGLADKSFIRNNSDDSRSQLICSVVDSNEATNFNSHVAPCGHFIINNASVEIRLESLEEYEDSTNGGESAFLCPYVDSLSLDPDNGVMTCIPDAPIPYYFKFKTQNKINSDVDFLAQRDLDITIYGFYAFTKDFIQTYQPFTEGGTWGNLDLLDAELKSTKPFYDNPPQDYPDYSSFNGVTYENYFYSYIPSLISMGGGSTDASLSAPFSTTPPGADINAAAVQRVKNSLQRFWGWLDYSDSVYFGPSTRATNNVTTVSQAFRDSFCSIVDGESGPGGQYRVRAGSYLSIAGSGTNDLGDTWQNEHQGNVISELQMLEDFRGSIEFEGSVSYGAMLGYNTIAYKFNTTAENGIDNNSMGVCKSLLPGWGWSRWAADTDLLQGGNFGKNTIMAANFYPTVYTDPDISVSNTDNTAAGDGYVGGGSVSSGFTYGFEGYPNLTGDDRDGNEYPGAVRDDSEVLVLKNRFYSSSFLSAGGRTFKSNAHHDFGIVYYDQRGRPGPVNRIGSIYVPGYSAAERGENTFGSSYITVGIENDPPTWAFDYQIVYSGNTSVGDFVQYTSGGAFTALDSSEESQGIYVSLNYLQGKEAVSYTNDFGARNPAGDPDLYNFKPGDRVRIISYYQNDSDRIFPINYEFDVIDYRILTNDTNNNPLYDVAADGSEVPENKIGTFLIVRNNTSALGFTYTEVDAGQSLWNNRCVIEIFSPIKDQDSDARPYYEISEAYPVVYIDGVLRHRRESIQLNNGDVWWRLMAVNMPNYNQGSFADLSTNKASNFRGYFLESSTFSDQVTRANVNFFGKPKFYNADEGEVRRKSSVTFSDRNNYSTNVVRFTNFNPNAIPFKDLSNKYGAINFLAAFDEFLLCLQENKVSRLPISRNIITDASGTQSLVTTTDIVGTPSFYSGSYGTDNNPESVTVVDNDVYFTHKSKRGIYRFNRLEGGIRPISDDGMEEFFDAQFQAYGPEARYVTGYDPDNSEFLISFTNPTDLDQGPAEFVDQPSYVVQSGFDPTDEVVFDNPCSGFEIVGIEVTGEIIESDTGQTNGSIIIQVAGVPTGDYSIYFEDQNGVQYIPSNQDPVNGEYQVSPITTAGNYSFVAISNAAQCESAPFDVTIEAVDICDNGIITAGYIADSFDSSTNTGQFVLQFTNGTPSEFNILVVNLDTGSSVALESFEVTTNSSAYSAILLQSGTTEETLYAGTGLASGTYEVTASVNVPGTDNKCFYTDGFVVSSEADPCGQIAFGPPTFEADPYNSSGLQTGTVNISIFNLPIQAVQSVSYGTTPTNTVFTYPVNGYSVTAVGDDQIDLTLPVTQTPGASTYLFEIYAGGCVNNPLSIPVNTPWATNPCLGFSWDDSWGVTVNNETFIGANDGQVSILTLISGQTPTFNIYENNNGSLGTLRDSNSSFTGIQPVVLGNLAPGEYILEVVDGECTALYQEIVTIEASIVEPPPAENVLYELPLASADPSSDGFSSALPTTWVDFNLSYVTEAGPDGQTQKVLNCDADSINAYEGFSHSGLTQYIAENIPASNTTTGPIYKFKFSIKLTSDALATLSNSSIWNVNGRFMGQEAYNGAFKIGGVNFKNLIYPVPTLEADVWYDAEIIKTGNVSTSNDFLRFQFGFSSFPPCVFKIANMRLTEE